MALVRSDFLPFSPPSIGEAEIEEVIDTLRSDWITTGPKTKRFEVEFAELIDSPDALALFSCTDALQVALAALGIGRGDAVLTTTMTFAATAHVVEHVGATPILVDVERDTLNIDPTALRRAIERLRNEGSLNPRAIIPVHYAGHPCDMAAIDQIAADHGLAIVEDAAHALPASCDGRVIGNPIAPSGVVRATAFSFYATKNLTTGEGGMLTGPDDFLAEARLWALHGMSRDSWKRYGQGGSWFYEVVRPGFKCNMTDIQASIGLHQLGRLDGFQRRRREVVDLYSAGLGGSDFVLLPIERSNVASAWHLYPIRLNLEALSIDRAAFIDELGKRNIGASVHFIPLHAQPFYRDKYSLSNDEFPVAWSEYQRLVSLPMHPRLTDDDVADVVDAVLSIGREHHK
ncbi:UDP-4-amino-4,6-dideoxy-N-acetyl-beta-L-altrosamine transaminase [soil metagenome]